LRCGALAVLISIVGCGQRHLPPGSEYPMAEILLRHELASPRSHLGARGSRCPCFVRVGEQDLPPKQLAALTATGATFLPGSAWRTGQGLRIRIGQPRHRWNGNFDVSLAYDCGAACVESGAALLRYDGARWRVIE
jgi:hypothetical protein